MRRELWCVAKVASVTAALGTVTLLVFAPAVGLFLTWNVLVPAVPALLLVAPQVWRNICPIAVVHQLPAGLGRAGTRRLSPRMRAATSAVAALLLFAIVPLRPALLNDSGPALAIFVALVLIIALAGGATFSGKSGWCATWCPVLPVERLYGQRPMLPVAHAHCARCTGCVRSCYDLRPQHSFEALIGRSTPSILHTAPGAFAAGFPGFVLGYFTRPAGAGIVATYMWIAGGVVAAILALALAQRLGRVDSTSLTRVAAAIAAATYYWFTVPDTARATSVLLDLPPVPASAITTVRLLLLLLPAVWLMPGLLRPRPRAVRAFRSQ